MCYLLTEEKNTLYYTDTQLSIMPKVQRKPDQMKSSKTDKENLAESPVVSFPFFKKNTHWAHCWSPENQLRSSNNRKSNPNLIENTEKNNESLKEMIYIKFFHFEKIKR